VKKKEIGVMPVGALHLYREWDTQEVEERENTVLFFGRLSRYKGIEALLEAEPLITREVPDARIVVAGRDYAEDRYGKMSGARKNIVFYNRFIPNREVPRLFRESSLVVMPYVEASQSGVLGLAYAFGKPVVATRVGSIPEVVEDGGTGLLVPPGDAGALASAVLRLLNDRDLRRRMGENAYAKACGELSWETIAKETLLFYGSGEE
jgi:glycosyltransferase involved in cell wall biosynthesis